MHNGTQLKIGEPIFNSSRGYYIHLLANTIRIRINSPLLFYFWVNYYDFYQSISILSITILKYFLALNNLKKR